MLMMSDSLRSENRATVTFCVEFPVFSAVLPVLQFRFVLWEPAPWQVELYSVSATN